MAIIGVFCFVFFIVFRKGIKLYQTRLVSGASAATCILIVCTCNS